MMTAESTMAKRPVVRFTVALFSLLILMHVRLLWRDNQLHRLSATNQHINFTDQATLLFLAAYLPAGKSALLALIAHYFADVFYQTQTIFRHGIS